MSITWLPFGKKKGKPKTTKTNKCKVGTNEYKVETLLESTRLLLTSVLNLQFGFANKVLPWIFIFCTTVACLTGCSDRPTEAQLKAWREEAIAQNTAMVALHDKDPSTRSWRFTIQGQTSTGKPVPLGLPQLQALATTSVSTKDPHNTNTPNAIVHFRGITVSKLLDEFGIAPNVTEVTFIARDAFRATVELADLRRYPIIIALERNKQKISRSNGGPLYLVFPYTQYPQLQQKYPDRFWAFYLTDLVVGTEPIQVKVGNRLFDAAALGKLPQTTTEETVGYRIGWPVGKVKLYGVRVRDALAAAGLTLPQNGTVIVQGKSPVYRDAANPIRLNAADVKQCDLLLATHWGDDRMPIPAKMGGPVTLALSSSCQTQSNDRRWVTFVERLEVTQ